jgi:hypothetical protein
MLCCRADLNDKANVKAATVVGTGVYTFLSADKNLVSFNVIMTVEVSTSTCEIQAA